MLTCLSRAPNSLPGWGLSLLLLAAPAPAQLLTGLLGNDTRRLIMSDSAAPLGGLPAVIGSGTAGQPGSRLEVESRYDDVFRERGTVRRNDVNRWDHRAVLKIPLGPNRGRLRLTYRQVQTEIDSHPFSGQSIHLGSHQQRLGLGYGRLLTGSGLHGALAIEATDLDGDWYTGYSLGLGLVRRPWLRLSFTGGRRFDGQAATWYLEDLSFFGSVTYRENWWRVVAVITPVDWLGLEASWRRGGIHPERGAGDAPQIWISPKLQNNSPSLGFRVQPPDGKLWLGARLLSPVLKGTSKFFGTGREFGHISTTEVEERDLQLWAGYRIRGGAFRIKVDRQRLTATIRGQLKPWSFGNTIFDQAFTTHFFDQAEAALDRLELGFNREAAGQTDWDIKLGYILVKPANRLVWWQSIFFFPTGEIHRENLNLAAAELLVPTVAKTWRIGPAEFTYAFTQVIPIRVRLRQEPPPGIPPEKTRKRGGGYHRLKLTYDW